MEEEYQINDIQLRIAFIGEKYDKLINQKFSIWAFLFGTLYFAYRKMLLMGILVGTVMTIILNSINELIEKSTLLSLLIYIAMGIIYGIIFPKIYINWVDKKITKIKDKTSDERELIYQCKHKGGTSVGLIFFLIILIIIEMVILGVIFLGYKTAKLASDFTTSILNYNFEYENGYDGVMSMHTNINLNNIVKIDIPDELKKGFRYSEHMYKYESTDESFEMSLSIPMDGGYDTAEDFINGMYKYYNKGKISELTINNIEWNVYIQDSDLSKSTYYCMTKHNDKLFLLEFNLNLQDIQHVNWCNEIIESMEFID